MMNKATSQRGAAMMEVLVSMLIVAFGVLGFVGLQAQTKVAGVEAFHRSQALLLVNDMAQRINANRGNAASYVGSGVGVNDPGDCTTLPSLAQRDLCEWGQALRGAAVVQGTAKLGAMISAQGCVTSTGANQYLVSVAWQGIQATSASPNTCGQASFTDQTMRRTANVLVKTACLTC